MTTRSAINVAMISIGITSFLRAVALRGGWRRREVGRRATEVATLTS